MADILIRGMEMPTVCIDNGWYGNCPMDRSWCARRFAPEDSTNESAHKEQWNKLPSWCPLLPIQAGHGRLGDLDALEKELAFDYAYASAKVCHNAPTIVPAEGESDFIPGMMTCTNCGAQRNPKFKIGGGAWNFCPNCGADMREAKKDG